LIKLQYKKNHGGYYSRTVHEDAGIGLQRKKFQETERP